MKDINNIIIPNPADLEKKRQEFKKEGQKSVHVLSSFDKTLTKATFKGKKIISFISKLRNGNYISKDYAQKAQELYDKYHTIEISNSISQNEKNEKMREWWLTHYKLLVECGLNKKILEKIIEDMLNEGDITMRQGAREFSDILRDREIPIIIMSASGLGNAMINFLDNYGMKNKNTIFIGNTLEFDERGNFNGIKDNRIIHTFNKNEAELQTLDIYKELIKRKNVILMCDSLADLNMINGFPYSNIIKIAFYNDNEENLEDFKKNFDIIITNDGSFEYVNELMKDILN